MVPHRKVEGLRNRNHDRAFLFPNTYQTLSRAFFFAYSIRWKIAQVVKCNQLIPWLS